MKTSIDTPSINWTAAFFKRKYNKNPLWLALDHATGGTVTRKTIATQVMDEIRWWHDDRNTNSIYAVY